MKILNHKLAKQEFIATKNMGGTIDPKFIIMHYTAGWTAGDAIHAFKTRKVSAQLIIERNGKITQMVPFNRRAWHAGPSRFNGYTNINSHSIGIEIVNIGFFRMTESGNWLDPYGGIHDEASLKNKGYNSSDFVKTQYPRLGSGYFYFPAYTDAQLKTLDEIVPLLIETYDIEDIGTHEEIDKRGWKTDSGPAFPMKRYLQMLGGERDDVNEGDDNVPMYRVQVTAGILNVREGAGPEWTKFMSLRKGNQVNVLDTSGSWLFIKLDSGEEGWVHGRYTKRV